MLRPGVVRPEVVRTGAVRMERGAGKPQVDGKPEALEPLLVPTLRVLVALPLVVVTVTLLLARFFPGAQGAAVPASAGAFLQAEVLLVLFEMAALLILIVPGAASRLGRWFLPLTLFFCTLGPLSALLMRAWQLHATAQLGAPPPELFMLVVLEMWPTSLYLLIPLIVIAWQYTLRAVVLYTLGLALLDLGIAAVLIFDGQGDMAWAIAPFVLGRTVVFVACGFLVSRLVAGQRGQRAELRRANRQLAQVALTQEQLAVSRERNRLARDLHDTLAHYMSGLVLELEGTRLLWETDRAQAAATLDDAIATARQGLTETRRALQALRATPLADLGLAGALRDLAETMAARNQWQLELHLPEQPVVLSPAQDEVIYRVIQEGLANVARHAQAQGAALGMRQEQGWIVVALADDGCGFDQALVDQTVQFGLLGMRERAEMVGGVLEVSSQPGRGTTVTLTLQPAGASLPGEMPR